MTDFGFLWRDMEARVRQLIEARMRRAGIRGNVIDAASIRGLLPAGNGVGVDHGGLTGLGDDDHPQYTTNAEATTIADTEAAAAVATHAAASDPHTGYLLESLLDAKGDLIAASADNTPGRLAVGTNGQGLLADSAQTLGVRWGTVSTVAALDDLTDVTITSAALYDRLRYDGSAWRNSQLTWAPLSDGDATSPSLVFAAGDVILVEVTPSA